MCSCACGGCGVSGSVGLDVANRKLGDDGWKYVQGDGVRT